MKRAIGISAVALLALAACQKKTETAATGTAAPAVASAPSGPMTPPPRKPGLWTQTVTTAEMKQSTKICLDASTEQKMKLWGAQAGKSDCSQQSMTPHLGGGWDFHSVCNMGQSGTVTSDGTARGDFNSHYTVEVNASATGSAMPQANGPRKITIDATWDGPCPPDMKPGDMEMPGGFRMNLTDAAGGKASGAGGHMGPAEIAKMRAQAMAMAKAAHDQK